MSRQVTQETRGTDLGKRRQKEGRKEKPALAGKHGSEGQEDGHGDGQPLCNALRRQEEGQPGDSKVDRGGQVGLDQVVPSTEHIYFNAGRCLRMIDI